MAKEKKAKKKESVPLGHCDPVAPHKRQTISSYQDPAFYRESPRRIGSLCAGVLFTRLFSYFIAEPEYTDFSSSDSYLADSLSMSMWELRLAKKKLIKDKLMYMCRDKRGPDTYIYRMRLKEIHGMFFSD